MTTSRSNPELDRLEQRLDEFKQVIGDAKAFSQFHAFLELKKRGSGIYKTYLYGRLALEGSAMPEVVRSQDLRRQVDLAISVFESAVGSEQTVVVWRVKPTVEDGKLYFRCHFMTKKDLQDAEEWNSKNPVVSGMAYEDIDAKVSADRYVKVQKGTFSWALEMLVQDQKVARRGWNGKGMFIFLVPGSRFQVNRAPLLGIYPAGTTIDYCPHVDMRTAQGTIVPWLCSQTDMLAVDWELVT